MVIKLDSIAPKAEFPERISVAHETVPKNTGLIGLKT